MSTDKVSRCSMFVFSGSAAIVDGEVFQLKIRKEILLKDQGVSLPIGESKM